MSDNSQTKDEGSTSSAHKRPTSMDLSAVKSSVGVALFKLINDNAATDTEFEDEYDGEEDEEDEEDQDGEYDKYLSEDEQSNAPTTLQDPVNLNSESKLDDKSEYSKTSTKADSTDIHSYKSSSSFHAHSSLQKSKTELSASPKANDYQRTSSMPTYKLETDYDDTECNSKLNQSIQSLVMDSKPSRRSKKSKLSTLNAIPDEECKHRAALIADTLRTLGVNDDDVLVGGKFTYIYSFYFLFPLLIL